MPYTYTVADAIRDSKNRKFTAATATQILGDASASLSHAKEHMKSEDFWATQRTDSSGAAVGTVDAVDGHLKSAYKKRTKHSMFDSPLSSVEAITAALNTEIGELALKALLGKPDATDGIDLYSRTAVATLGSTKQFTRSNTTGSAAGAASMNDDAAEYVVVCLRKTTTSYLVFASAYPVASNSTSTTKEAGKDWFQSQKDKSVIRSMTKTSPPVVIW
ncbi:hypothetical protein [Mesorhizobium sp. CAU 1741]|uniref:hypothetical protein n=1 Tax=Mesorhizobium sp. CAU 1741 TaxID=3140366 RepID=UPI00325B1B7F